MSTITIMAALADLPGGVPAIPGVDDGKGNRTTVQAVVVDDVAKWSLPDTDANRELFQQHYKPSGRFRAQVENVRPVKPIDGESVDSENDAEIARLTELLAMREEEIASLNTQLSEALAELSKIKEGKAKK